MSDDRHDNRTSVLEVEFLDESRGPRFCKTSFRLHKISSDRQRDFRKEPCHAASVKNDIKPLNDKLSEHEFARLRLV